MSASLARLGVMAVVALGLSVGCGRSLKPNPIAVQLDVTTRTTERYHVLAEHPFDVLLGHDGYVVALEKIDRAIAHPDPASHPYAGLIRTTFSDQERADNPKLVEHLLERLDDRKVMVVTHVLAYDRDGPGARFLYNVYDHGGLRRDVCQGGEKLAGDADAYDRPTDAATRSEAPLVSAPACGATDRYFARGLEALTTTLKAEVAERLSRARAAQQPYTHLVLASMGWDNDQVESVRRYAATLANVREAAGRDGAAFRPLFIGITWPSVWGWASWFDFGQLVYKLIGYGNKADDADEVGYTTFNYLLNGLARSVAADTPIVAFGHSFGGRVVSRALFGDHLLNADYKDARRRPVDLFLGLQPAFSIHRFIRKCPDREGAHCGNEGSPYEGYERLGTRIVITTSKEDTANPLAWWISRARHAGGQRGLDRAREHPSVFRILDAARPTVFDQPGCQAAAPDKRVILVDARSFVFDHNDVLDLEAGELIWGAIRCFTSEAKQPATR